ncbi:MAG: response regulator [Rhodospirillales bacterium]|nr:response regulator [Rhodospirillales bacterium]MCB9997212.1 response regulator [Rhodospirillales bacterium]
MKYARSGSILILVADDDETMRSFVAGILESHGFQVLQAVSSGAAIRVIEDHDIDVAIIAHRMKPNDGFEIAKHVVVNGLGIGMVMVTGDPSTDLLLQAGQYEIGQVMRSPVDPDRLLQTVRRMIRARGKNPDAIGAGLSTNYSPEELMRRVIALASQNAKAKLGGPFAAIVTDSKGHILGEGVNGVQMRCDPTAHAEVLAIRHAAERHNSPRLEDCVIYCSSEPTMLGQALIISTGISRVYYGISHEEAGTPRLKELDIMKEIARPIKQRSVPHEQLCREEAMAVFKAWQETKA